MSEQETRTLAEFARHYGITFQKPALLKLALTHRSYLSVTGQGPRESNERLEFLGDSVLGLVTSEFLYRQHPTEHEGQLTKTKSLLVSKAILSRRALAMGLGRFVLMSHSEIESGGRQRLSILADAFEAVVGAIYLDQGFEAARAFIARWLLQDSREIVADKRHTNFKSHLQEYVQSTYRTHPVYRIRSEMGPDHSKQFNVEVMVGKRVLGSGRGANKKEAEQAAARNALEAVEAPRGERASRERRPTETASPSPVAAIEAPAAPGDASDARRKRRGRRGGRGRRRDQDESAPIGRVESTSTTAEATSRTEVVESARPSAPVVGVRSLTPAPPVRPSSPAPIVEPGPRVVDDLPEERLDDDDFEEVGRPEGPLEDRRVDPYEFASPRDDDAAVRSTSRSVSQDPDSRELSSEDPEPTRTERTESEDAPSGDPRRAAPTYGRRGGRGRR